MLLSPQSRPCFLAHLALKATFTLPPTQGHTTPDYIQDKNQVEQLQTVKARLNHSTCTSSLSHQHKMQQQAGPFCQYSPFILPLTHHKSAVPAQLAYIKADTHTSSSHPALVSWWDVSSDWQLTTSIFTAAQTITSCYLYDCSQLVLQVLTLYPSQNFNAEHKTQQKLESASKKLGKYLARGSSPGLPDWLL